MADETLAVARHEGFDDAELIKVLALLASNIFSNYLSRLARTEIDYKRVGLDDAGGQSSTPSAFNAWYSPTTSVARCRPRSSSDAAARVEL